MPDLPPRPSVEHLRKAAKTRARERAIPLARAQRALAEDYGFANWAALVQHVDARRGASSGSTPPPLLTAVRAGDLETVHRLIGEGVNPRLGDARATPLHAAARRGPLELVETLLAGGALEWQPDRNGRTPLDVARRGQARERAAIVRLLDRGIIDDASFRAAVAAVQLGDLPALTRLLDTEPRLLRERIIEPAIYRTAPRSQYFRDPKLFWFIANNPTLVERMPANIVDVTRAMIERGVEQADLDYALELVMTSGTAREQGHQLGLMRVLSAAGARVTAQAIVMTAGQHQLDALRALVADGLPLTAPLAAALGMNAALPALLRDASHADVHTAFSLAVINGECQAAKLALAAGADVNARLAVHAHSTALHQAAINDDAALIGLLLAHGARTDLRDSLWDATAFNWAVHQKKTLAQRALESAGGRYGPKSTSS